MNDIEKIQEYVPTVYVNDSEPDLNETNLNKTEEALKRVTDAANKAIDALKQLEQEKLSLSAISSVLSDANDKVPSLALVNAMQKEIDETNSNLGNLQGLCNDLDTLWSQDYVSCVAIKRFSGGTLNTPHKQDAALTAGRADGFVISLFLEAWGVQVAAYVGDAGNCLYRRGLDNGTKSIWSAI